jgi:hypothetical protein
MIVTPGSLIVKTENELFEVVTGEGGMRESEGTVFTQILRENPPSRGVLPSFLRSKLGIGGWWVLK